MNATFSIILVLLTVYIYYVYLAHPHYDSYEYYELKYKYKTGDIILFHGLDNVNPIFIGSYYGHIGIVYVDPEMPEKPYIFEAFNTSTMPFYPVECRNGIALVELEHRLNSYRGYAMYKELINPVSKERQEGFKHFIDYALDNMKYNENVINNGFNKLLYNEPLSKETNCGELVYMSLIKLGILPYTMFHENRKHHLLWLSNLNTVDHNKVRQKLIYRDPVYILANYFKPVF